MSLTYVPATEHARILNAARSGAIGLLLILWWGQPSVQASTSVPSPAASTNTSALPAQAQGFSITDLPDFVLTNELGAPVNLRQFKGKAVALTFFFTRCPIPEFCPRLSKNFAEASQKLAARREGPTNWHFLSVSFDALDTPAVLKSYAKRYQYDSKHWSFLTGKPAEIRALTAGFGLEVAPESGVFNHDFRTVVFDATGRLQAIWPFAGNMSDVLVDEIIKAAAVKPESALAAPPTAQTKHLPPPPG